MIRLFEQHRVRRATELDGIWKFEKDGGKVYSLPVPGCWEQHPDLLTYRGAGVYEKKVFIDKRTNIRLEFGGVSHTADVFFDGEPLAHHYNAFTPFSCIASNVSPGKHDIRVRVDNSFGEHSALHTPNDYYTYGGIIRPVVMEEIGDLYLKNVHFLSKRKDGKWMAQVTAWVENIGDWEYHAAIEKSLAGISQKKSFSIGPGECTDIVFESEYEGILPWNPVQPNLYELELLLYDESNILKDDLIERVGFREIQISGSKLCINGNPVFLKGFNRHEDYGTIGSAVPFSLMVQDMDLMQQAGANAVRTCHYPNDARFLDLCDERGICVWEESHARGFGLKQMQNPNFDRQSEDCIREMIECHYNHPSIVIWGILNECASETPGGREIYEKQYEQVRALDGARPATSATCRHFADICLDLPDIVSVNMYSGWYENVSVAEGHKKEMDWIAATHGKGKPVIISEFGAGAIYGYRDRGRCKWSEERQADIIQENLEVYQKDERLAGIFIWQFADCKVTEEEWFAARAKCHNNKGIVDEYRRPKMAFDIVKEMFAQM